MNLIKNLKGYWKRLTTPKPDENFTTTETTYGEIQVSYLKGIIVKYDTKTFTMITMEIIADDKKLDIYKDIQQLRDICGQCQIQFTKVISLYYIQGSVEDYLKLFSYNEFLRYENKILGNIYSKAKQINIIGEKMTWETKGFSDYYPYMVPIIYIKNCSVYLYAPLTGTTLAWIYITKDSIAYSIESFYMKYTLDGIFYKMINESYPANAFILPDGTNILEINKSLNASILYDDIDEVL